MAMNLSYYTALVESFKVALTLLESIKPLVTQLVQFAEDHLPNAKGSDKLKVVMDGIKAALSHSEDLPAQLDVFWNAFSSVVSVFVSVQKILGNIKPAAPAYAPIAPVPPA